MTSFVLLVAVRKANFQNALAISFLLLHLFKQTFVRT